ncbi:MAG TPA: amino acid permease [Pilimelia sp.]|nr:amino acid permease [Pilimelia sp.]
MDVQRHTAGNTTGAGALGATAVPALDQRAFGGPPPERPANQRFGLPTASALVVGSVIGTGVLALPSALAAIGPISLVAFGLVTVGAIALALTFQALNRRVPGSGGPYLYARDAFGDFAGFLNAWSYWITAWAGNAAIVVAWVGYVEVFWNWRSTSGPTGCWCSPTCRR